MSRTYPHKQARIGLAVVVAALSLPTIAEACGRGGGRQANGGCGGGAPSPKTVERLKSWPLLDHWLSGEPVDREPMMTVDGSELELARKGAALFATYCVNCHGAEGRGDGPRSAVFKPPPRDFTRGVYAYRSTPSGCLPTREDLFRTITGGRRGTGMLPFADLPEEQRWALAAYVETLSPRFADEGDDPECEPIAVPPRPRDIDAPRRVARGRSVFTKLGCVGCHGPGGRGDGPNARFLHDDAGQPIHPRNFVAQPLRRGEAPEGIFLTPSTGLNGTPMPAFPQASSDDIWSAVAFVRSLARDSSPASRAERDEAYALANGQYRQGVHAVVDGCGCQARRR